MKNETLRFFGIELIKIYLIGSNVPVFKIAKSAISNMLLRLRGQGITKDDILREQTLSEYML